MAPVTTLPHKSGGHQRYLPEKTNGAARYQSELEVPNSDAEAGALQPVKEPEDADFEGFGNNEDNQNDGAQDEESDGESIDIQLESKKKEKPVLPKDAEEEELEHMIFGDSEGFRQGLENFSLDRTTGTYGDESDEAGAEEADLDNLADQDLFFFDAGPVTAPAGSVAAKAVESDDENGKPAWEDSDDERLVVSLASVPQLKKLRETAEDDMVNGKDYARRLRKQYERLHPAPDWATHATGKANKKRRRTMDDDESGEESASDMDVDDEDLSTQPLARLLKDADILSRTSRSSAKRRKLQAGTIDIQRLKDVAKSGPVSVTTLFPRAIPTNKRYSLPSLRYHSTLRTRYSSLLAPVPRSTSITSTPTHRTRTRCSPRCTSNAHLSSRPHSILRRQIRASSSAQGVATSTCGTWRLAEWRRCLAYTVISTSNALWRTSPYHQTANTWLYGAPRGRVAV
jgi:U3 small nucleolar RNA-associated protein 18